ncbi:MAG: hypothetical protein MJZ89_02325 [Paludibacteraceae bacterium]|nr:hypothetical protein [Paludibacteraceae bacterium]
MKKDIRDIVAYIWSVLWYPAFTPTYMVLFFCLMLPANTLLDRTLYSWIMVLGTAFITGLCPLLMLLYLKIRGKITDFDVSNAKDRTRPYIYSLVFLGCWCYFMKVWTMPPFMVWSGVMTIVALIIVLLINLKWKISAHLCSMGGVLAVFTGISMHYCFFSWPAVITLVLATWLLMLARIRLEAHTPLQTVCGFLLGFILVMIPNIIFLYA